MCACTCVCICVIRWVFIVIVAKLLVMLKINCMPPTKRWWKYVFNLCIKVGQILICLTVRCFIIIIMGNLISSQFHSFDLLFCRTCTFSHYLHTTFYFKNFVPLSNFNCAIEMAIVCTPWIKWTKKLCNVIVLRIYKFKIFWIAISTKSLFPLKERFMGHIHNFAH